LLLLGAIVNLLALHQDQVREHPIHQAVLVLPVPQVQAALVEEHQDHRVQAPQVRQVLAHQAVLARHANYVDLSS
jgi:hypothetical protein